MVQHLGQAVQRVGVVAGAGHGQHVRAADHLRLTLLGITLASYMTDLVQMLPYVVTVLVLIAVSMRKKKEDQPPAHLGLPYFREER